MSQNYKIAQLQSYKVTVLRYRVRQKKLAIWRLWYFINDTDTSADTQTDKVTHIDAVTQTQLKTETHTDIQTERERERERHGSTDGLFYDNA